MLDPRFNHAVAVAHAGSFTEAANQIGLTQSAITKSIADLERELGYSIFHRTARGVVMTEQGAEFIERVKRLLDDVRELFDRGAGPKDPFAKPLRIGVCPASLEWLLAAPLAALLARHPSIKLDVAGGSFERISQLLRNGGVDVAVGFEEAFSEIGGLKREPIAALRTVLFVRKGHPILCRKKITGAILAAYDFVLPSFSRPFAVVIQALFEEHGLPWQQHVHTIDSFSIVKRVVAASDVIGVTTVEYAKSKAFSTIYEQVPGNLLFIQGPMCCAIRTRWEVSPPVREFLYMIKKALPAELAS
ncbi:LysR family transcriptional regulator [Kineobactrum salinum]|uniref:LysR family transcriptional regulator n=1 Tax=Kineobactrum salinum TaxID=2708301 RepID=A0A6C0U5G0_9GAMM|nr:LysR family transcriptional regulator [Kineobactrum salinum]QIB67400.1 LysR family transcriptional regulator [Kineobactrum salinum]